MRFDGAQKNIVWVYTSDVISGATEVKPTEVGPQCNFDGIQQAGLALAVSGNQQSQLFIDLESECGEAAIVFQLQPDQFHRLSSM
jgi:hypothetical protein